MQRIPSYPKKAHASGQARVRVNGKSLYLGVFGSKESKQEYAALVARLAAGKPAEPAGEISIARLVVLYLRDVKESKAEKELWHCKRACAVLVAVCPDMPAAEFSVATLSTVRRAMIDGSWLNGKPGGAWCRNQVNAAITRVRALWRWAEGAGHVPRGSWFHLRTLKAIPKTDRGVRQTKPRQAVGWEEVSPVLPLLPPALSALAQVQWWTGMRPSEVCRMRKGDVEKREGHWLYWLRTHKNIHRAGREREAVVLGAEAQRALSPWLESARLAESVVFPSVRGGEYTVSGYTQAVSGVFERNPGLTRWTPYQLRHGAKRRITRELGLDAARATLRQSSIQTTDRYDAERDMTIAIEAAKKTG
jgi:integrase